MGYAGFRYAGFGNIFGATTYPVRLQLAESGGIFTGADVTYRGVSVGRVGPLTLIPDGVEVQLDIRRDAPAIPADLDAAVHNLSAIGEQYVDLHAGHEQRPGARSRVGDPGVADVHAGAGREARGEPRRLRALGAAGLAAHRRRRARHGLRRHRAAAAAASSTRPNAFTADAVDALPQTLKLIRDGRTVLTTQNDVAGSFQSFSRDLALLADQLRSSDPDLRRLLQTGPDASWQVRSLLRESGHGIGELVANLLTVSRVAEPRQDALRQLLVTYPGVIGTTYTVLPDDGTAHLGLVINVFDPFPCSQGYEGTDRRPGNDVQPMPPNSRRLLCGTPRQPDHRARRAECAAGGHPQAARGRPGRTPVRRRARRFGPGGLCSPSELPGPDPARLNGARAAIDGQTPTPPESR